MAKRARKSYTEAQREKILSAAQSDDLTALDIQKRFGVTPVTYYSWRKKRGINGPRGRRARNPLVAAGGDLSAQVRAGVQSRVRDILPSIVREEVAAYLNGLFGGSVRGQRRRGRPQKMK